MYSHLKVVYKIHQIKGGIIMATKPAPRKIVKKPVKPVAKPKPVQESVNTSEMADLKKIIDMQAKQLLQLNKTVGTLQTELKEVKVKIAADVAKPASAAPAKSVATKASPAKAAPAKTVASKAKTQAKKTSAAPAKAPVKTTAAKVSPVRRGAAKAKTPAPEQTPEPVKVPAKRGRKLVQPALDTMVPVPVSVSERLNTLTASKKITQTKFAEEVDVPPNLIFDIAAQKVKTISLERIQKITTALKMYETK
jgi:hypothetical protein